MPRNEFEALLELYEYRINGSKFEHKFSEGVRVTLSFRSINFSAEILNFEGVILPGDLAEIVVRTNAKIFDAGFDFGNKSIRVSDGINVIGVLTSIGKVRGIDIL